MAIRLFLFLVLTFSSRQLLLARLTEHVSDQQIFDKADLVVIATVVSTTSTNEHTTLPEVKPPVSVVGLTSDFEICVTLKGAKEIRKVQLHHYKTNEEFTNGPELVEIPQGKHPTYLLFLIRENDGRYAPATGQTDPSGSSVFRLRGANERGFAAREPAVLCQQDEKRQPASRFVPPWTYQSMVDKADLVAIADWVSAEDADERSTLPGVEPPLTVVGVATVFETILVLKGAKELKEVTLHHYRVQNDVDALRDRAPQLVKIAAPRHGKDRREYPGGGRFLLFLTKEPDNRFAPVTNQTDPAVYSVLQLLPAVRAD